MMRIRRGRLNLGAMKRGTAADLRRAHKMLDAHRAGRVDAIASPDGRVRFYAVPKKVRKARAKRQAQRRARRIMRMHA